MPSNSNFTFKFDLGKLNQIVGNIENKYVAKVGILGNNNQRDGNESLTNSQIGATHEYGSFSQNIPRRSFLKDPLFKIKKKQLMEDTIKIINKHIADDNGGKIIFKKLGLAGEAIVKTAFATGGFGTWKPLSPLAVARKGSDRILIDTAQLRKSITSKVEEL